MEEIGAKLRYVRRFNLGQYQHEEIEITIEGPYKAIKEGQNLVADLVTTSSALGTLATSVFLQNRKLDAEVFKPQPK